MVQRLFLHFWHRHHGYHRVLDIDAGCATYEHRVIYRHVGYAVYGLHLTVVAQDYGAGNGVVGRGEKLGQGTVDGVVFARLHLYGEDCEAVEVVDQEIHFATLFVVVVVQLVAVGVKFLCDNGFIDRTEVYAALVAEHGVDIQSAPLSK